MKIAVCSDLHLEFGDIVLNNDAGVDVLILSGDICVASHFNATSYTEEGLASRYRKFFEQCNSQFPVTLMVMGNHEHFDGEFSNTYNIIQHELLRYTNITILAKETYQYMGYVFFGGTLWTDMNDNDEATHNAVSRSLNDFQLVSNKGNLFTSHDAYQDHKDFIEALEVVSNYSEKPMVVLSHHAPSRRSTNIKYRDDQIMNGGYSSNLDQLIMDHSNIALWTHGHTHYEFDYMIGSTRIVCNPRGYINHEERADAFQLKVIEV